MGDTVDNDFALLILCNPLKFRREVSSVCLPELEGSAYDNVVTTVTGWGSLGTGGPTSDKLMGVNVNTLGNAQCNNNYEGFIEDSMICATAPGKDARQGDSGGPMTTREAGNFYSKSEIFLERSLSGRSGCMMELLLKTVRVR